jgi:tRNA A-37 threonylcarbamoyl transferase component Bud32
LASGEVNGEAFLLVEAVTDAVELRHCRTVCDSFARTLGSTIARLHDAGIDQPDLFAKHILLNPHTQEFTLIDWQRARLRTSVTWPQRVRSLAALLATSTDDPSNPPQWWDVFMEEYSRLARGEVTLPTRVAEVALQLCTRPNIHKQRHTVSDVEQPLVRINGEAVASIPALVDELKNPAAVATLYDMRQSGCIQHFGESTGLLRVTHYSSPFARWWQTIRGKAWRSDELKLARLLFHLERYGITAPKLLAYGQRTAQLNAESFVLYEVLEAEPIQRAYQVEALDLLDSLHRANCLLNDGDAFGIRNGQVIVSDPTQLQLCRRLSAKQMTHNLRQCEQWFEALG